MAGTQGLISLNGKIALVTGASRGIGKGVAKVLVSNGADVYITGRKHRPDSKFKSVMETAEELNAIGSGKCYGRFCDHKNADEIDSLFAEISRTSKRLDILVNSAYGGADDVNMLLKKEFWEVNPTLSWEKIMDVGLRSAYICSCKAATIMKDQGSGLIVNISSMGALVPFFGVLYSVGKDATDKMSCDMGIALKPHNVTVVSLWPGMVKTELATLLVNDSDDPMFKNIWKVAEDPTSSGKAVYYLATDSQASKKTARVHLVADLAQEYGFTNEDGRTPVSSRSLRYAAHAFVPSVATIVPHFLKLPSWVLSAYFKKF